MSFLFRCCKKGSDAEKKKLLGEEEKQQKQEQPQQPTESYQEKPQPPSEIKSNRQGKSFLPVDTITSTDNLSSSLPLLNILADIFLTSGKFLIICPIE